MNFLLVWNPDRRQEFAEVGLLSLQRVLTLPEDIQEKKTFLPSLQNSAHNMYILYLAAGSRLRETHLQKITSLLRSLHYNIPLGRFRLTWYKPTRVLKIISKPH